MITWRSIIGVFVSIFLSLLSTYYQRSYLINEAMTMKHLKSRDWLFFISSAIVYCSICLITFYINIKNENAMFSELSTILLWQGLSLAAWLDWRVKKIPNTIILILIIMRLVFILCEMLFAHYDWKVTILSSIVGMIVAGIVLIICRIISKGGIGAGDIKLMSVIGLYAGIVGFVNVMFYSMLLAAVVSIIMLLSKKAEAKTKIPMALFIFVAYSVYCFLE